jgi:2-phospho-L-lactate/phosphoenolpyruvate guanylyltransferase
MAAIVVPFRGSGGKTRLRPLRDENREALALAMLGDVLAACDAVAPTYVVTSDERGRDVAREFSAHVLDDPAEGLAAAVAAGLAALPEEPSLVVNADLPWIVPHDVRSLECAIPDAGIALVAAADGTTNALALATRELFAPLYGAGSAARFRAHAAAQGVEFVSATIPNLAADVDRPDDLDRLDSPVGPRTLAVLSRSRGKAIR